MLIFTEFFKTQSQQKTHQTAPLNFYSRLFQNTHQNASIVKCFQKFLRENYPTASVYVKYLFFI